MNIFASVQGTFEAIGHEALTAKERARIAGIEASLIVLLSKARQRSQCERELYELGANVAAERAGCCRRTVYNRAESARKAAKVAQ